MNSGDIARYRLLTQQIAEQSFTQPGEVVSRLGAIQAQDFAGAKWSIGLRLPDATEANIVQAIADREIVRTWPIRGTLHFVAAADIRWMLELLAPRMIAGSARRQQQLELNATVFSRCKEVFVRALQGGKQLSRDALYSLLEAAHISTASQRGYHILWRLAQEGLICFAAPEEKQQTFALLEEWIPAAKSLSRDEALAELTRRYFIGHGPATLRDFVWWSGLKVSNARTGLELVASQLAQEKIDETVYWMSPDLPALRQLSSTLFLLPGFDEYMLGYADRSAALHPRHAEKICPGSNGMFSSTIVIDGQVVGTWKRTVKKGAVVVEPSFFGSGTKAQKKALSTIVDRYGRYVAMPAKVAQ